MKRRALVLFTLLASPCFSAQAAVSIPFTVNTSEAVTVDTTGGTPRIAVDVGGNTRYATYTAGSGTSALTFTLSPTVGDVDLDGVAVSSPINLNGGTIKDSAGNNATLTFAPPNTSGIKVDYPSLSMDFINNDYILSGTHYNTLTSFVSAASGSFTRASTATYFDSTGNLQTAANDVPRFDYDPVTNTAKGILIEESRTNLITYSKSPGFWGLNGATVSATGLTELNMFSSVTISSTGANWNRTNMLRPGGVTWAPVTGTVAVTFYYKAGTSGRAAIIIYDATTGQTTQISGNVGSLSIISQAAGSVSNLTQRQIGSVYAVSATFTPNSTTDNMGFGIGPNSVVSGESVVVLGGQLEYGAFPTSFIPTTTATVTRSADALTLPTGGWYAASGTLFSQGAIPYLGKSDVRTFLSLDDNSASNVLHVRINDPSSDKAGFGTAIGGVNTGYDISPGAYVVDSSVKLAAAYQTNNLNGSANGQLGVLNTSVAVPSYTKLRVGVSPLTTPLSGWVEKARYYPLRVTDPQLQLLTQ